MIGWHYGSSVTEVHATIAKKCDVLFAADAEIGERLAEKYALDVTHLPPAVQPKLQNPIELWETEEDVLDQHHFQHDAIPHSWARLFRVVQRGEGSEDLLPPNPITWMDDEMRFAKDRFARAQHVLLKSTLRHRLEKMDRMVSGGVPHTIQPLFSVLVCTNRPYNIDNVFKTYLAQTYNNRELILVLHGSGFDERDIRRR